MKLIIILSFLILLTCANATENNHQAVGGNINQIDIILPSYNITIDPIILNYFDINKFTFILSNDTIISIYDNKTTVIKQDGNIMYYYVELV